MFASRLERWMLTLWFGVWAVVAPIAVVATVAQADQQGETIALHAEGDRSASLNGVELTIVDVTRSASDTTVVIQSDVDEGDGVLQLAERSRLVLDDGTVLSERKGERDGNALAVTFEAIPQDRSPALLRLRSVTLAGEGGGDAPDQPHGDLVGNFSIGVPVDAITAADVRVTDMDASAQARFGAVVEVTGVRADAETIIVDGRLDNVSASEARELGFDTTRLTGGDVEAEFIDARLGFDADDPGRFVLRFENDTFEAGVDAVLHIRLAMLSDQVEGEGPGRGSIDDAIAIPVRLP